VAEARDFKSIGTRPVRPDGIDKVTGRANFGADLSLPNMLHGKILRSPHAHARIKSIDLSKALASEDVLAAVSGVNFPAGADGVVSNLAANIIARDKVLYHGHAVAAVVATTPYAAERALDEIEVVYEPLSPVLDIDSATADGAPLINENLRTNGDAEAEPSNVAATTKF